MSYIGLKIFLVSFLVLYCTGGFLSHQRKPEQEVYPFFSWFLFPSVPYIQTEFVILIHEFNGKTIEPPRFSTEIKGVLSFHGAGYYKITQELGRGILNENEDKIENLREQFEKLFLSHPVLYEVVQITFDPIERWKTEKILHKKSISMFHTQEKNQ